MRRYCLYLAMKKILNDLGCPFSKTTYNNRSELATDALNIYIRGGVLPRGRVLATGEYLRKSENVGLIWKVQSTKENILNSDRFGVNIDDGFVKIFDYYYTIDRATTRVGYDINNNLIYDPLPEIGPDDPPYDDPLVADAAVVIIRVTPQSSTINIRTPQGLTEYSDNFLIEYTVEKAQT